MAKLLGKTGLLSLGLILALAGLGCSDDPASTGCTRDSECRGGRACVAGACTDQPDVGRPDIGPDADPADAADAPMKPDVVDVPEVGDTRDLPVDVSDVGDGGDADEDFDASDGPDVTDGGDADIPDVPGELGVDPVAIDFGDVGLFVSAFRDLTLRNTGGRAVLVSNVRLRTPDSAGFQLLAPGRLPLEIPAGESAVWQVRFQPTQLRGDRPTRYGNFVVVDAAGAPIEVALEGLAVPSPARCLTFDRPGVDLGYVSPNNVQSARLELRNCGTEALDVLTVDVERLPETLVTLGRELPIALDPGVTVPVVITYTPSEVRSVRGRLLAAGDGAMAVTEVLSAPDCPTAVAAGRTGDADPGDRVVASPGDRVELTGLDSEDPTAGELRFTWRIEAPEGSMNPAIEPGLEAAALSFTPDVVGTWTARLRVVSARSGLPSCNEAVVVVNVFPETPQLQVSVTWNNRADLDLHMVREVDGAFPDFGAGQQVQPNDCYFNNQNPDWGVQGSSVDDPRLLGDDTDGEGPETILYPVVDPSRRLRVGINYARRRETDSADATVAVRWNGEEIGSFTQTLTEQGAYWIPVIIGPDGSLSEP